VKPKLALISDFFRWKPIPPKTAKQLAQVSARLCRLLRDEVIEQIAVLRHNWHCGIGPALGQKQ
jgi:hypothetical protein